MNKLLLVPGQRLEVFVQGQLKDKSHLSVTSWRAVSLVVHIPPCSGEQDFV